VIEGTVVGVGAVAAVAAQLPMDRKLQPADRWGRRVCGPKIVISADGLTVTDVARNPKTGDGTAGRYRPVLSEGGVASGRHTWDVKIASPGRLCVGVATDEVKSDWDERGRRAIVQTSEAWTVCVPSKYGSGGYDQIRMRHGRGEGWLSGLPTYAKGDVLGVHLDCEKHTLSFTVNGKPGTRSTYKNLPAKRFYLAAAFGGDGVAGASLTLLSPSSDEQAGEGRPEGGAPVQPSVVSSAELALARELFEKRVGRWAGRASLGSCTTVDLAETVTWGGAASCSFEVEMTISLCCIPVHFLRVPGTYSAEGGSATSFDGSVITMILESADLNARTVTYRYGGTRKDGSLQQGYEVVSRDFIEKRVPRFTVRLERQ
jgi:hypothetical protein